MKQSISILIATVAVLLSACTELIDIKTSDSSPVVVIYSVLTDELKYQRVMISRSSSYFNSEPNAGISDATVVIQSSADEWYPFVESDSIAGLYFSKNKFRVQSGLNYSLAVEVEDKGFKEKYEAFTTVPPTITADSLVFESFDFFGRKNYILYIQWQDSPEENYYLFNVLCNDSLLTAKLSDYRLSDNTLYKGQYVKGGLYRFSDFSNWEKDSPENRKNFAYLKQGDIVAVKTSLIPKGYFDFIEQCQREQRGENPMFGGPASNIVTNISNGGLGYFAGYCVTTKSVTFQEIR
jgi:hypothetical protein